ncbi:MAG: phage minor capsid protein [Ruminococcus sp.]|nr:phage minor capsid protein [Ruminococcus sp.]
MLSPSEYDRLCDNLTTLYDDLDNAIIEDITRRILKTGKVTETAKWQAKQLQESGLLYDDIVSEIANRTDATAQHVKALFEDAGVQSVRNDNRRYRAAGLEGIVKMSDAALQTLYAGYLKCNGDLRNLTLTTANATQTAYINACNLAYMQVTSGAFSYQEAIRQAVQRAARDGAFVQYPSGHRDRLDVAVRRAVLTGVGQTVRQISLINANDMGCDLMEITAHSGARPSHAKWQGKIVSLSGKKGYLSKKDIGYGTGDGFGGWNCRHDWYPFFEGISERAYSDEHLKELDAKNIEYNGKMYSEYEISQIQRRYEREIRAAKREQLAFETAVEEADDPELRQVMQDSFNYSKSLVRDKQAKMRDFINQTGQNRDYFREQNYPKENSRNDLTPANARGIINGRSSGKAVFTDSDGHYAELIGKIDYNDKKAVARSLMEFENKYKDSDIEHCRIITVRGDVYEAHGDRYTVNTNMLGDLMKGSINEHNHVTGESQYSFSWDDIKISNIDGTNTAFAFDEKYRYVMMFPDNIISDDDLYDAYDNAKSEVGDIRSYDHFYNRVTIPDEDEQHEIIKRTCERLGIKYGRQEKR